MVILKTQREIEVMRDACRISALALAVGGEMVKPGVTTREIDRAIEKCIRSHGATPSFLGYGGFPASACISVNDEVIHGIPGDRVIREGDIVSVDVGAHFHGYHGDNAATFAAGVICPKRSV
jgi:methionyl aminopeptidase